MTEELTSISIKSKDGNLLSYKNAIVEVNGKELPMVQDINIHVNKYSKILNVKVEHYSIDKDGGIERKGGSFVSVEWTNKPDTPEPKKVTKPQNFINKTE